MTMETIDIKKTKCWNEMVSMGFRRCQTTFEGNSHCHGAIKSIETSVVMLVRPINLYQFSKARQKHMLRFGWRISVYRTEINQEVSCESVLPSKLLKTIQKQLQEITNPKKEMSCATV